MMATDARVLFYSLFGLFAGIALFFNAFTKLRQKRLIEGTPTSKIRSIAMGQTEIFGEAIADKNNLISSPFSAHSCLYCRWTIEEYKRQGKSSRWVTIRQGTMGNFFFVKDDTGIVTVDPKGANVDIPMDFQRTGIPAGKPGDIITSFLEKENINYKAWIFNKQLRFTEYYIAQGDRVYVMGYAGDNPFVEDGFSKDNAADIMIQKGKSDFYYISDRPEKEILKSYGWKVMGGFFGGGMLIVVCLFIIFAYFNIL